MHAACPLGSPTDVTCTSFRDPQETTSSGDSPQAGGQAEQLTMGPSMFLRGVVPGGFALSPDGTTLVYSAGEVQESLWLRRGDGSEAQLTFEGDARTPSVSDDGQRMFYIAGPRFRPGPIRMRRIDSDEDRPLATGQVALGVWSAPDGERFVFTSRDADGSIHLWLGATDNSTAPRQMTSGQGSDVGVVFERGGRVSTMRRTASPTRPYGHWTSLAESASRSLNRRGGLCQCLFHLTGGG